MKRSPLPWNLKNCNYFQELGLKISYETIILINIFQQFNYQYLTLQKHIHYSQFIRKRRLQSAKLDAIASLGRKCKHVLQSLNSILSKYEDQTSLCHFVYSFKHESKNDNLPGHRGILCLPKVLCRLSIPTGKGKQFKPT